MATSYFFDNKQTILPGAYSTIKSTINIPSIVANYGRVLVIDNGTGAGFGGGSGINGDLANGQDAIYRFSKLSQSELEEGKDFSKFFIPSKYPCSLCAAMDAVKKMLIKIINIADFKYFIFYLA